MRPLPKEGRCSAYGLIPPGMADDRVTCVTCHLPHGKDVPETQVVHDETGPSRPLRSAAKPLLRSDVSEQFCASRHGAQAPRLYLCYHQPDKRVGLSKMEGGGARRGGGGR